MTGGVHRHLQAGLTSQSTAWSPSLSTPSSPSSPAGVSQGPGVALAAVRGAVDPVALPRDAAGALDARRRFGTSSALGLASDAASDAPWESTASRAAVRAGTSHGGGKSGRWMRLRGSPASGVEASSGCGGKDDRPLARPPRPCRGLRGTGGGLTAASWAVGWTSSGSGVFSLDGGSGWATSAPARPAAASSFGWAAATPARALRPRARRSADGPPTSLRARAKRCPGARQGSACQQQRTPFAASVAPPHVRRFVRRPSPSKSSRPCLAVSRQRLETSAQSGRARRLRSARPALPRPWRLPTGIGRRRASPARCGRCRKPPWAATIGPAALAPACADGPPG